MAGLKDRLIYADDMIAGTLERIAEQKRPVGLIGAGAYSKILRDRLPQIGISPRFVVLDEKYISGGRATEDGFPIITPAECAEKYPDACLIIAFTYSYENEWAILRDQTAKFPPETDIYALGAVFLNELDTISGRFVKENIQAFEKTYDMLADGLSRRIMAEFLNAKISGNARRLLMYCTDTVNDYELKLMSENMREGVIAECGAFDGISALQTDAFFGGTRKIYAMEPVSATFDKLCRNVSGHASIIPLKKGTGDSEYTAFVSGSDGTATVSENGNADSESIDITTIDRLLADEKVAAITMDIEGSELAALKGARKTIMRDRPVLAVRVYHKPDDLIVLPEYIASLQSGYKLYLRVNNSRMGAYDTTLYAI